MDYGTLSLRIDDILKEKASAKIKYVRTWIFPGQISTDTAVMNFRGLMPG